MRKQAVLVVVLGLCMSVPALSADAVPRAVVDAPRYDFAQVIDGTVVTHDFVIQNRGNAPLTIGNISSD